MAKEKQSGFHQIFKTIRLLSVLIAAAIGLVMGSPWHALVIRLFILWAALYLIFGFFEVLLQFLSAKATEKILREASTLEGNEENAPEKAQVDNQ